MKTAEHKTIQASYFAVFRELRGLSEETIQTKAATAQDLYCELQERYNFPLPKSLIRVSINNVFKSWTTELQSGDQVAFIPPVSGG